MSRAGGWGRARHSDHLPAPRVGGEPHLLLPAGRWPSPETTPTAGGPPVPVPAQGGCPQSPAARLLLSPVLGAPQPALHPGRLSACTLADPAACGRNGGAASWGGLGAEHPTTPVLPDRGLCLHSLLTRSRSSEPPCLPSALLNPVLCGEGAQAPGPGPSPSPSLLG